MSRWSLAALLTVLATSALAALPSHAERPPLDEFLSRRAVKSLPDARGFAAPARAAFAAGHVTSVEPRLGVPTFFWSSRPVTGSRTFRSMGLSPQQAARRFLFAHAELYRGEPSRWAEAVVSGVHDLHDGGAVIVSFQQRVKGLRVFRDELDVVMTRDLELVALAGYLTPELKPRGGFALSDGSAIAAAFQDLTGQGLELQRLKPLDPTGDWRRFAVEGEREPARVRSTWFPTPEGLEPGLYVELDLEVGATDHDAYSFVVSAVDGRLLYRKNLTASDAYTYRVWADATGLGLPSDGPHGNAASPHPTGTPNAYDPGQVLQSVVTLQNGPISTNDPWLDPGAQRTNGNNAFAYVDVGRPNGFGTGDLVPTPTGTNAFDRTFDTTRNPDDTEEQRLAAATQLFYNVNFFHDWYYDVGFNEAAGNAQLSNLGRGGAENDQLRAEAQDYSGRNNANMSTPSDGASPRMQMYIFDGTSSGAVTLNTTPPQAVTVNVATFGPQAYNLTAEVVLVDDGNAMSGSTLSDGCSANFVNSVAGKIALIDRGLCTFSSKVLNAQANGAVGVIIADNQTSTNPPPLSGGGGSVAIPAVSVTRATGQILKAVPAGTTATLVRTVVVDRDGTLDNAIVAHEWGHYISNRLIGDGNGISNLQAVGMGEGWADFHALLMMVRAEDVLVPTNTTFNGVYGVAGYTSYAMDPNGYYYGIRRLPYSTDFAKNGLTFKHIQDNVALPSGVPTAFGQNGRDNSEVHNTGEVWATMLWECYAGLLKDPRLTFDQARDRMRGYLVAAYKATALMPTFVDARDALLAVAAAQDIADYAVFWTAFARRGLGMLAVAPDRDAASNRPAVESFDVGNALVITDVTLDDSGRSCDSDGQLDALEDGWLSVTVKNIGVGPLTQSTVTITTTAAVTFPDGPTVAVPALQPFGKTTVQVKVAAMDMIGIAPGAFHVAVTDPTLVVPGPVTRDGLFRLNFDIKPAGAALDDVEAPMSLWTSSSDPNGNTGSNWRIFQATATTHHWFGPNPASPADTWLISPNLTVGTGPFTITFQHRYDFEKDAQTGENYDGAVLEVSQDNGATWTDVGSSAMPGYSGTLGNQGSNPIRGQMAYVGKSPNYPTFNTETVSLGTTYASKTVQLRFRIGSDDAAAAKGWEVDDIAFQGITNTPFTTVVSDPNTCTNQAPSAVLGADQEVPEGTTVTLTATLSDPDGDAVTPTWTQKSGPAVTITGSQFTAPQVTADTALAFDLTVSDGRAMVGPFTQTVLVKNVNRAPTASVPAVVEMTEGLPVTVLGTGADADGDVLTYAWTQVGGPTVALTGADTEQVGFTAPVVDADTVVALELVVSDALLSSAPARVEVVVKNQVDVVPQPDPKKTGCGCTSGLDAGALALLALVGALKARRRR